MNTNSAEFKQNTQSNESQLEKIKNPRPSNCSMPCNIIDRELLNYSADEFNGARVLCYHDFVSEQPSVVSVGVSFDEGIETFYVNDVSLLPITKNLFVEEPDIIKYEISGDEFNEIKSHQQERFSNYCTMFDSVLKHSFDFNISSITMCATNININQIDFTKYDVVIAAQANTGIRDFLTMIKNYIGTLKFLLFVPEGSRAVSAFCEYYHKGLMFYGYTRNVSAGEVSYPNTTTPPNKWHTSVLTNLPNAQNSINITNKSPLSTNCSYTLHSDWYRSVPKLSVRASDGKIYSPLVVTYADEMPDDYMGPMFVPITATDALYRDLYDVYLTNAVGYYNYCPRGTFPWNEKFSEDTLGVEYSPYEIKERESVGEFDILTVISLFSDDVDESVEDDSTKVGKLGNMALVIPKRNCSQSCISKETKYRTSGIDRFVISSFNDEFKHMEIEKILSDELYREDCCDNFAMRVVESLERESAKYNLESIAHKNVRKECIKDWLIVENKFRCQVCGKPFVTDFKTYGRGAVDIQHCTPVSDEGEDKPNNTILVCCNCHRDLDKLKKDWKLDKQERARLKNTEAFKQRVNRLYNKGKLNNVRYKNCVQNYV